MILLEYNNRIIKNEIEQRLEPVEGKREPVDVVCVDFDGVQFHISNPDPNNRDIIRLSLNWRCLDELLRNGAREELQRLYGSFLQSSPEQGYGLTLQFDMNSIPGDKARFPEHLSNLKRNALAAPFRRVFSDVDAGKPAPSTIVINYREDEAFYIKGDSERVFVVFSVRFRDPGDQIIAKVFLQEYADARKTMSNAPSVASSLAIPGELSGLNVVENPGTSFVTFVLFKNHITAKNAEKTIANIQTFRNYLHYHIKCSKAYLHNRMRLRVDSLLQILNRSRPAPFEQKEKKLISGKTFVRKV
eukprot:TRINITY_DN356_c0_g1_i1.p1 TRINITY_DN356_c0_g1~~TRINITY_DN356_c0_g1_i1.p1  ORF type:complete len:302 (-),score=151.55 TRINITY_DN356_c0_g1_i1:134-1039(-)